MADAIECQNVEAETTGKWKLNQWIYVFTSSSPPAVKSYSAVPNWGFADEDLSSSWDPKLWPPDPAKGFSKESCFITDEYDGGSSLIWKRKGQKIYTIAWLHVSIYSCFLTRSCKTNRGSNTLIQWRISHRWTAKPLSSRSLLFNKYKG